MKLRIKPLPNLTALGLPLPRYETAGASGMDLRAAIPRHVDLRPGQTVELPSGVAVQIPEGYEAQIRSRSGLARTFKVVMLNGVGTIDSDYRGEISTLLHNCGTRTLRIHPGDRVAQMVICPVEVVEVVEVEELEETERGDRGYGSTGIS